MPRLPAWILAVGLLFLGYYALLLSTDLARPEPLGLRLEVEPAGIRVRATVPDSVAARAGLAAGDRLVAANSRPLRTRLDWTSVEMNLRMDQPLHVDVKRGTSALTVVLMPARAARQYWTSGPGLTLLSARLVQLVTLVLALVVAFRRPLDPAARAGAWVLATIAVYSITWQFQLASRWRALPSLAGLLLWLPFASSLAIAAVVFTFFAIVPRPLIRSRSVWLAVWAPMAAVLLLQLQFALRVVYQPERQDDFFDWTAISAAAVTAYTLAAIAVVIIGYRRLIDVTERRRVRVMAVGSSIGLLSALPVVASYWGGPPSTFGDSVFASPAAAAGSIIGLALPASFAYAILRHRLFDLRLMLRLGLQYALARRVLVSLVPLSGGIFLADLWIHRQTPFGEVVQARGWIYAALALFAVVARLRRDEWLDALDRRYFRERLNAQRLLRAIGEEIRNAAGFDEVAQRVVTEIDAAFHPVFVAVLARHPDQTLLQTIAFSPATCPQLSLPSSSKLIDLVRLIRKPIHLGDQERSSLFRHLPPGDVAWVSSAGVEALVPIQPGAEAIEALFVLGPKRSEEPYGAEDDDLLMAIADNVAWLLRRTPAVVATREAFEECPACGRCFDFDTVTCQHDAAALTVTQLPRVLAARYHLERRVGRGGMGAVYAAYDRALSRQVAVKVLREDLVMPGATERFQSEARLAAALAHRNVVTVYDFGVTPSGRAFFVMELLNGVTLRDELRRSGRLPANRVLQILRQVGEGVALAHRRHMVHRDLKPENVFLCPDEGGEVAKVLDFGLAKALEGNGATETLFTTQGMVAGTPQYMAPEHLAGGEPCSDWDLWALAVMAFEMIAGALPAFGNARTPAVDGLPTEGLRALFLRALSPNPLERPATIHEFLDELTRELKAAEHALL